jgi:hypothetical protein
MAGSHRLRAAFLQPQQAEHLIELALFRGRRKPAEGPSVTDMTRVSNAAQAQTQLERIIGDGAGGRLVREHGSLLRGRRVSWDDSS